ncbi:MAG: hypothetical protein EA374_04845 [Acholeplasmatales bacterium]|nr:MAG: hypothetical protein EA374_04845 [Acholeplasmatales bacterium]
MFETLVMMQPAVVKMLKNSHLKDRLSHAYIFEGDSGTGTFEAALYLAARLLCEADEDRPCGVCSNCRRVMNTTHPNVHIIRPARRQIVKEDIRLLQEDFNKTALENGAKIYIIEDAHTMNAHASNALLKFLEEPHPNLYGVLLARDAGALLETLRSRSQTLHFTSMPRQLIEKGLVDGGYPAEQARLAASMTHTLAHAEALLNEPNLTGLLDLLNHLHEAMIKGKSLVTTFHRIHNTAIEGTDDYERLLDLMIRYQKDLIYGKMDHYGQCVFVEDGETQARIVAMKSERMLLEELDMMLELKAKLKHYINERLAFDNLLLALERRMDLEETSGRHPL